MLDAQALAFKQVLSLMIAQRAPSRFLKPGNAELDHLTDSYVRLLAANGILPSSLRDAALAVRLELNRAPAVHRPASFVTRKGVTALRANLLATLGVPGLHDLDRLDLDRLDLTVTATLDNAVQQAVSEQLASVATRDGAHAAGIYGYHMLREQDDPSKIAWSFTLFERVGGANVVRVQTDSVDQPFDINRGARRNLGSTAKVRTVVTYLQIVAALHERYGAMSAELDYVAHASDRSLRAMLDAAVERNYSANPGETFYTGGAQVFKNFESSDNARILTVHRAFQHSANRCS